MSFKRILFDIKVLAANSGHRIHSEFRLKSEKEIPRESGIINLNAGRDSYKVEAQNLLNKNSRIKNLRKIKLF